MSEPLGKNDVELRELIPLLGTIGKWGQGECFSWKLRTEFAPNFSDQHSPIADLGTSFCNSSFYFCLIDKDIAERYSKLVIGEC
jgi:hypothetical protein